MASTKVNSLFSVASNLFRPAIVEAKLMTAKHARDAVYVATLAEELNVIDTKLAAMEEALQVNSPDSLDAAQRAPLSNTRSRTRRQLDSRKLGELDVRLHRIEQNASVSSVCRYEPAHSKQKEGARKGRPLP